MHGSTNVFNVHRNENIEIKTGASVDELWCEFTWLTNTERCEFFKIRGVGYKWVGSDGLARAISIASIALTVAITNQPLKLCCLQTSVSYVVRDFYEWIVEGEHAVEAVVDKVKRLASNYTDQFEAICVHNTVSACERGWRGCQNVCIVYLKP